MIPRAVAQPFRVAHELGVWLNGAVHRDCELLSCLFILKFSLFSGRAIRSSLRGLFCFCDCRGDGALAFLWHLRPSLYFPDMSRTSVIRSYPLPHSVSYLISILLTRSLAPSCAFYLIYNTPLLPRPISLAHTGNTNSPKGRGRGAFIYFFHFFLSFLALS
jgi:hypothetical protein